MPTFASSDQRVITIRASLDRVAAAMSTPETVRGYLADELESWEQLDAATIRYVRKPIEEKGVRFRGEYVHDGAGHVTWSTIGEGNMRSRGEARLTAVGDDATRVEYSQAIECDMEVNRLLAVVFRPLVERKLKAGITKYLDKVKASLEA
jgi:hypothetical protein